MGVKKGAKPIRWTKKELQTLKRSIAKHTNHEIAAKLGRTYGAVTLALHKRGIVRTKAARRRHVKATFPKGHIPWNRGLKGIHLSPETQFKKGNKPANTKFDGCISIRYHRPTRCRYKYIRIAESKWELLNRWKWEKYRGKIPPRHIVGFKNGDTLDCRLKNLYLMSKAKNAIRNRNIEKSAIGLRRAWKRGDHLKSDEFIASTFGFKDKSLREQVLRSPQLIELQRMKIKLKRAINGKVG